MSEDFGQKGEALAGELHRANEEFHRRRMELEKWMEASEYRHVERVEAARERLKEAEKEVERVEAKIRQALGKGPDPKQ